MAISIVKFLENVDTGLIETCPENEVYRHGGWYDWFCSDKALRGRTLRIASKVGKLYKILRLETDAEISLKNCCPLHGSLFDQIFIDFRGFEMSIIPSSGHDSEKGQARMYAKHVTDGTVMEFVGTWKELCAYLTTQFENQ